MKCKQKQKKKLMSGNMFSLYIYDEQVPPPLVAFLLLYSFRAATRGRRCDRSGGGG